jgi:hypothetical protein
VALASMVRGRSQFSAAAPVAGDVASSGSVGELPLVVGSTRSTRTASSSVVDARRLALPALLDGYLAPAQGDGGHRRRQRWSADGAAGCVGQGGTNVRSGRFFSWSPTVVGGHAWRW